MTIISELYFIFMFFFIFFYYLTNKFSNDKKFLNVFFPCLFLFIIILLNVLVIDYYACINLISNKNYFIFNKNIGDVLVKNFIVILSIINLLFIKFYVHNKKLMKEEYIFFFYLSLMSIFFFVISYDILSLYLLLECQSLCYYVLTSFNKKNKYSLEAGLKYFILSSLSSVLLLFGFSIIYGFTGIFSISELYFFYIYILESNSTIYFIWFPIILLMVAFCFKLYIAPFHFWVIDIYNGAPTFITSFFATVTTFPMFYLFTKLYFFLFSFFETYFFFMILLLSISSMFIGSIGAFSQKNIKKLMALSSVTNIGYCLSIQLSNNIFTTISVFIYYILYSLIIISIFSIFCNLFTLENNSFVERFTMLSGLYNRNKYISFIIITLVFGMSGIPPFSLFFAKVFLLISLSSILSYYIICLIILAGIFSFFYYLKIIKYISFSELNSKFSLKKIDYICSTVIYFSIVFISFFFISAGIIIISSELISLSFIL